jgi:adenosine 3'-phospho 5'-phosphosulfate transporter B2
MGYNTSPNRIRPKNSNGANSEGDSLLAPSTENQPESLSNPTDSEKSDSMVLLGCKLMICLVGLQCSYLMWGILQEVIMTRPYGPQSRMFPSALYLVCMNRFSQLIVASIGLTIKMNYWTLPENISFINYAPSALSNSLSSWAQYSALHYISFPTQTVFKSSKVIPVMLMGKVLNGKSYSWAEYVEALFVTFGILLFILEDVDNGKSGTKGTTNTSTDLFGVALLCIFVFSDCFTRYP